MSRSAIPFAVDDISALARSLEKDLTANGSGPGHVKLLNMLARGAGFRNFQHLRAQIAAEDRLSAPPPPPKPVDAARLEKLVRYFDAAGTLVRWPGKDSQRTPVLRVLWSRIAPRRSFSEPDINVLLNAAHSFGDPALLRREMFDRGMLWRTTDGRAYRRIEGKPAALELALIRVIRARTWGGCVMNTRLSPLPRGASARVSDAWPLWRTATARRP